MIKIFTSSGCSSCRKLRAYLEENNIDFSEVNIFNTPPSEKDLREILALTINGTDDIIAKKSKIIKEGNVDLDDLSLNDLIAFIQKNPSILRRPIIIDGKRLRVGFYQNDFNPCNDAECENHQD